MKTIIILLAISIGSFAQPVMTNFIGQNKNDITTYLVFAGIKESEIVSSVTDNGIDYVYYETGEGIFSYYLDADKVCYSYREIKPIENLNKFKSFARENMTIISHNIWTKGKLIYTLDVDKLIFTVEVREQHK